MPGQMIQRPDLEGDPFVWEAGPVGILLCHGFTATTAEVRPLARILHAAGYTIQAPLLPGHYTTPQDLNRVSWRDWVETVEAAYAELKARCSTVFAGGESTGGLLSLYLGARHPEIAGILTYAPALRLKASRIDQLKLRLLAPFIPYIEKEPSQGQTPWQGYTVIPLNGAVQLLHLQSVVNRMLPDVRQPTLIVQGRLDTSVHPSVPDYIAGKISSRVKEVHLMEASSHVVIIDRELAEVAHITEEFIRCTLEDGQDAKHNHHQESSIA